MGQPPLDLESVKAFVLVAELESFTRAAEAVGATQAAVSLRLKRLEERLGCKLIERTPRYVQPSTEGLAFLHHARELLKVHELALSSIAARKQRLTLGISDHVAGPELPALIARINMEDPELLIEVRIGSSGDLLQSFDRRELDAAIVRLHAGRPDGAVIAEEQLGWLAAPNWQLASGGVLPIATLAEPCGVRAIATELLDAAGVPWTEVFVGGGVAAVSAAVMARLGVAALSPRMLPDEAIDVGEALGLPQLPRLPILLHTRVRSGRTHNALCALCASLKTAVQR